MRGLGRIIEENEDRYISKEEEEEGKTKIDRKNMKHEKKVLAKQDKINI